MLHSTTTAIEKIQKTIQLQFPHKRKAFGTKQNKLEHIYGQLKWWNLSAPYQKDKKMIYLDTELQKQSVQNIWTNVF